MPLALILLPLFLVGLIGRLFTHALSRVVPKKLNPHKVNKPEHGDVFAIFWGLVCIECAYVLQQLIIHIFEYFF